MQDSPIKLDESVVFFPTYGALDRAAAAWNVNVHGWIYEPSTLGGIALHAFRTSLELGADPDSDETFRRRAGPFVVDNERGKAIPITFDVDAEPEIHILNQSAPNGHLEDSVQIPRDHVPRRHASENPPADQDEQTQEHQRLQFQAVVREGDVRSFRGEARLIPPEGLSVISDIDDTVKITGVKSRRELLRNTFLRAFQAVQGMAERYSAWNAEAPSPVAFHYVTASPWQLFAPLQEFLADEGFPSGTMHMKHFRWRDSTFLDLFREQITFKTKIIERILRDFPDRRFVLVGDSGEQDAEIYGAIARQHPEQIIGIYVRNVSELSRSAEKLQAAFHDVPDELWQLFENGQELPKAIEGHST